MPVSDNAGNVAVPSVPEMASREAAVALLTIETVASFTIAPFWSLTITIIVAVFGDCARAVMKADRIRGKVSRSLFFIWSPEVRIPKEGLSDENVITTTDRSHKRAQKVWFRVQPLGCCLVTGKLKLELLNSKLHRFVLLCLFVAKN